MRPVMKNSGNGFVYQNENKYVGSAFTVVYFLIKKRYF